MAESDSRRYHAVLHAMVGELRRRILGGGTRGASGAVAREPVGQRHDWGSPPHDGLGLLEGTARTIVFMPDKNFDPVSPTVENW